MVPGKKYAPEDFVAIAWTRKWFIIVPFVFVTAGAVVYAQIQPDRYRAQTQIIVTPQQVPADFVRSTVTTMLADRLQMIQQQILSRARLERIIEEFNLYPELRASSIMEDVVERMRSRDINIAIAPSRRRGADTGAFSVGFESDNPRTALLVTERLASLFIRENMEDRAVLADATSQFLEAQLEEARRQLVDHEKKLQDYRLRYAGSLPTQVNSNLQGMQTTQLQLQSLQDSANRDRDRRLFLERALADAQVEASLVTPMVTLPGESTAAVAVGSAAQRLEAARAMLRGLEIRLKPEHPDVRRMQRTIRDLEQEAEAEALQRPVSDAQSARAMTPAERARQSRMTEMRDEIEMIDRRIETRSAEEQRLRAALAGYQARLESTPARESELTELMRDYNTLTGTYNELLRKSQESKLAVNLERRQIGEQFKIVDAARLPERPFSPNRPRIIGMGAVIGLGLGLALVGLLEYRDTSLKTDDDVVTALSLPVLALIPAMVTRAEERTRLRRRRYVAVGSLGGVIVAAGLIAWKLQLFQQWVG